DRGKTEHARLMHIILRMRAAAQEGEIGGDADLGIGDGHANFPKFTVIARSDATKQSMPPQVEKRIASRSLSSGAHSRDPLARNDDSCEQPVHEPVGRHGFALLVPELALVQTVAIDPEAQALGILDAEIIAGKPLAVLLPPFHGDAFRSLDP